MMLWLTLAVLMALALGFLIRPMLRRPRHVAADSAHDLEVYRDQLAEVERDRERGLIDAAEAEAAKIEIQRRMIAADERTRPTSTHRPISQHAVLALALAVPLAAGGLYLGLGRPDLVGLETPASARRGPTAEDIRNAAKLSPEARMRMIRGMVDGLAARLQERPDDLQGWLRLGRAWEVLGEAAKARDAYARAAALAPKDIEVQSRYMMALVRAHPPERPLSPEMKAQVERLLALDKANPLGLYFAGIVAAREGRREVALAHWEKLLPLLPEGSPLRARLIEEMAALKRKQAPERPPEAAE